MAKPNRKAVPTDAAALFDLIALDAKEALVALNESGLDVSRVEEARVWINRVIAHARSGTKGERQ